MEATREMVDGYIGRVGDLEKLAIAHALIDYCKQAEKSIRERVDYCFMGDAVYGNVSQKRLTVNGEDVGSISARRSKAVDKKEPIVIDAEKLAQWMVRTDGGLTAVRSLIATKPDLVLAAAMAEGELPDGVGLVQRTEPSRVTGTTLRVDKAKVVAALRGGLPEIAQYLIEEGGEA